MKTSVRRRRRRKVGRGTMLEAPTLERSQSPSRIRIRWVKLGGGGAAALSMILGLGLLGLGVPGTIAAWASFEAMPALEKIGNGQTPTESELEAGTAGLTLAIKWVPTSRRLRNLAAIEISQALLLDPESSKRSDLLANSEQFLMEGLRRSPVDAVAWLMLAQVRMFRGEGGRQIVTALLESLHMAPNDRFFWKPRTAMLLRYWRFLEEPELRALRAHLRTLWSNSKADRANLLETALAEGQLGIVAAAVGEDPLSLEAFERMTAELNPRTAPRAMHK